MSLKLKRRKQVAVKSSEAFQHERKRVESNYLLTLPLWIILIIILVWGMVILYSVSAATAYIDAQTREIIPDAAFYVRKQITFTIIGLVGAFIISRIPIDRFKKPFYMYGIMGVVMVLLIATRLFGVYRGGAKRWLNLGIEFQTSELLKVGAVVAYAIYRDWMLRTRSRRDKNHAYTNGKWHFAVFDFIIPVTILLVYDLMVLVQPHTSGFIIIGVIVFVCVLVSGLSLETWLKGLLPYFALGILALGLFFVLPDSVGIKAKVNDYIHTNFEHVFTRIALNADDSNLSKDDTMQYDNAFAALGSGGMNGVGIGNSRSKYHYVPEAHTDYIFAIYVEETGMIGGSILIALYMIMFLCCMRVALRAKDVFSRIISAGYTTMIMLEAVLNISVNLQIIPPTGVSLPFVSYGGTAQVIFLCTYGMILCVARTGTRSKYDPEGDTDPEFLPADSSEAEEISMFISDEEKQRDIGNKISDRNRAVNRNKRQRI